MVNDPNISLLVIIEKNGSLKLYIFLKQNTLFANLHKSIMQLKVLKLL
jgi:hypothetical protein